MKVSLPLIEYDDVFTRDVTNLRGKVVGRHHEWQMIVVGDINGKTVTVCRYRSTRHDKVRAVTGVAHMLSICRSRLRILKQENN